MRRFWLALVAILFLVSTQAGLLDGAPPSANAAACRFVLGFQAVHDLIPTTVGDCKANEHYNPENGDALQETIGGLLVWRKADNFTAFTDGYRSWVNGPYGLQQRLNSERFPWEPTDPQMIALSLTDMPTGFSVMPTLTKYTSNDYVIKQSKDPTKAQATLIKWGRVNGYRSAFDQFNATGFKGTAAVVNDVDIYQNTDGAHTAFDQWEKMDNGSLQLTAVSAPAIGDESKAFRIIDSFGDGDKKVTLTFYYLIFRKGSVLSSVGTIALPNAANFDDTVSYSRIVESHIK